MEIKIDVTDWDNEYLTIEPDLSLNPILDLQLKKGMKPAQIARLLIVGRQRGDVSAEILPADKLLLMTGGAYHISGYTAMQRAKVEVNGKTYDARAYVAPVNEEDEGDDHVRDDTQTPNVSPLSDFVVPVMGEQALENCKKYLTIKVPGYIWGRLLIIAANGGNVSEVGQLLKGEIDRMVSELGE